jgi:hypothetical protein
MTDALANVIPGRPFPSELHALPTNSTIPDRPILIGRSLGGSELFSVV